MYKHTIHRKREETTILDGKGTWGDEPRELGSSTFCARAKTVSGWRDGARGGGLAGETKQRHHSQGL
jgi:hypothetical protein